jgi:hypothetical protein
MEIHTVPKILFKLYRRRAQIDLSPEYQRGKVWSKNKQQLLIDTILKKMHIPPIYFRVLEKDYYECVDGQQRLTAIFDFFDGKFVLSKKYSGEFGGGLYYANLPDKIKDDLEDFEIVVFEMSHASDDEIRDMFDRLQRGMPLTAGEKLNARSGKIHSFISSLTQSKFFSEIVNVRNYRGAYYQMCSQILALEVFGIKEVKFRALEDLHNNYKDFDETSKEALQVKKVINFLVRAFDTKTPELYTRAGIVSLYLLVSQLMKEYSLKDKENSIKKFVIDFQNKLTQAEENEDLDLMKYLNAIGHSSDGTVSIKTRHEILMSYFLLFSKNLEPLDKNRGFTEVERITVYRKNDGCCQSCKKEVEYAEFHIDHIIPHTRGGKTIIENGQVLCKQCNLSKGAK